MLRYSTPTGNVTRITNMYHTKGKTLNTVTLPTGTLTSTVTTLCIGYVLYSIVFTIETKHMTLTQCVVDVAIPEVAIDTVVSNTMNQVDDVINGRSDYAVMNRNGDGNDGFILRRGDNGFELTLGCETDSEVRFTDLPHDTVENLRDLFDITSNPGTTTGEK